MDFLRTLVSENKDVDPFNALVSDYNSRCNSFRYRERDLQAVEAEVAGRRQALRVDAQRVLASWRMSPAASSGDESLIDITTVSGAARVQRRLQELGLYSGAVDGIWGSASRTALRIFKLSRDDLDDDDRWDLATQKALMSR